MKTNKNHIQQGDVLIKIVPSFRSAVKKTKTDKRGCVLAEGEHTGHYHANSSGDVDLLELEDGGRAIFNDTDQPQSFTHQEHNPVIVPPRSKAIIGIVREKDWFTEMVRNVVD